MDIGQERGVGLVPLQQAGLAITVRGTRPISQAGLAFYVIGARSEHVATQCLSSCPDHSEHFQHFNFWQSTSRDCKYTLRNCNTILIRRY
jgi:hypothetical protein